MQAIGAVSRSVKIGAFGAHVTPVTGTAVVPESLLLFSSCTCEFHCFSQLQETFWKLYGARFYAPKRRLPKASPYS